MVLFGDDTVGKNSTKSVVLSVAGGNWCVASVLGTDCFKSLQLLLICCVSVEDVQGGALGSVG